jgi:glycosyltransferase involved in cell wall biosynthesis
MPENPRIRKQRVFYLASESPAAFNSGARMRCAFVADALYSCAELCVWSFSNPVSETDPTRRTVPWELREFSTIKSSLMGQFWRYLKAAILRTPIASDNYFDAARKNQVAIKLVSWAPDIVIFGNSHVGILEPLVRKYVPQARIILDTHNVEWHIFQRVSQTSTDLFKTIRFGILAYVTRYSEKRVASACDEVWAVSDNDAAEFIAMGARNVVVIPNVIPLMQYCPKPLVVNRSIAFVGWYNYVPNEQAALFLIQCSIELARRGVKHSLHLIGRDPTASMYRAAKGADQIHVAGEVVSARDEMVQSDILAAPIFAGSGTKFKLLEAFALARAVVTTPLGIEGLDITDGYQALICQKDQFRDTLEKLLASPELAQTLASNGRSWIEKKLSPENVRKTIEERIHCADQKIT